MSTKSWARCGTYLIDIPPSPHNKQKHVATLAARGNTPTHIKLASYSNRGHVQRMYTTNLNQRQNYTTKNYQAVAESSPASLRKDGTHIPTGLHGGASNSALYSKISAAHPPVVPSFMVVGASDRGWQVNMYESTRRMHILCHACIHTLSTAYTDEQDTKHI